MPIGLILTVLRLHLRARERADDVAAAKITDRDRGTELAREHLPGGRLLRHDRREPQEERIAAAVGAIKDER